MTDAKASFQKLFFWSGALSARISLYGARRRHLVSQRNRNRIRRFGKRPLKPMWHSVSGASEVIRARFVSSARRGPAISVLS